MNLADLPTKLVSGLISPKYVCSCTFPAKVYTYN